MPLPAVCLLMGNQVHASDRDQPDTFQWLFCVFALIIVLTQVASC
jgi:hypothetical protein